MDTIIEELKNSENICIIPKDVISLILQDNIQLHKVTARLNERATEAIEKLTEILSRTANEQSTHTSDLNERLDRLIERVSTNNSFVQPSEPNDVDSMLKKRREAVEKLTRNEELSKYYEQLINEPEPFVRREFRTRVNQTTTERELVHRRQQAIEKVQTEIKIMRDRIEEYTEKKRRIETSIQEYIASNEEKRGDIENKMSTQSRMTKEKFNRTTLRKLKQTDDQEKMNCQEYLITVAEESKHRTQMHRRPGRLNTSTLSPYWVLGFGIISCQQALSLAALGFLHLQSHGFFSYIWLYRNLLLTLLQVVF